MAIIHFIKVFLLVFIGTFLFSSCKEESAIYREPISCDAFKLLVKNQLNSFLFEIHSATEKEIINKVKIWNTIVTNNFKLSEDSSFHSVKSEYSQRFMSEVYPQLAEKYELEISGGGGTYIRPLDLGIGGIPREKDCLQVDCGNVWEFVE